MSFFSINEQFLAYQYLFLKFVHYFLYENTFYYFNILSDYETLNFYKISYIKLPQLVPVLSVASLLDL